MKGHWVRGAHRQCPKHAVPEAGCDSLGPGFPKATGSISFMSRKVESLAAVLERYRQRQQEAAAVDPGNPSVPSSNLCLSCCICRVTHCHNTRPVVLGWPLWPEIEARQHYKCSEHSFIPGMDPCLSAGLSGKCLPSSVPISPLAEVPQRC